MTSQHLWQSVLLQAVTDAMQEPNPTDRRAGASSLEKGRAYILEPHQDFATLCYLAGLNPDAVREGVIRRIAEHAADPTLRLTLGRKAKSYTHKGRSLTAFQWANEVGLPQSVLSQRFRRGWPIEEALTAPVGYHSGTKTQIRALPPNGKGVP